MGRFGSPNPAGRLENSLAQLKTLNRRLPDGDEFKYDLPRFPTELASGTPLQIFWKFGDVFLAVLLLPNQRPKAKLWKSRSRSTTIGFSNFPPLWPVYWKR